MTVAIALRFLDLAASARGVDTILALAGPYLMTRVGENLVYIFCPDDWPAMQQALADAGIAYEYQEIPQALDVIPFLADQFADTRGWQKG